MRADRRGIALIIVVLALAGVFALVMQLALLSRASQAESRALIERLRDERDARSAAVLVIAGLSASAPLDGEARSEPASAGAPAEDESTRDLPEIVKALLREAGKLDDVQGGADQLEGDLAEARRRAQPSPGVGDGGRSQVRIRSLGAIGLPPGPVPVTIGQRRYEVQLRDATGGLNINTASEAQLLRYFEIVGVPRERAERLAAQLVGWRDPTAAPLPGSAQFEHERALGVRRRGGEFQALEELLFLRDMDRDLYNTIRSDLCLTGDTVHAASASEAVLGSMDGMTEPVLRSILDARERFRLTQPELERLVPGTQRDLRDSLRAQPLSLIEIVARRTSPPGPVYRGLAIIGDRGIAALGLKLDDP